MIEQRPQKMANPAEETLGNEALYRLAFCVGPFFRVCFEFGPSGKY